MRQFAVGASYWSSEPSGNADVVFPYLTEPRFWIWWNGYLWDTLLSIHSNTCLLRFGFQACSLIFFAKKVKGVARSTRSSFCVQVWDIINFYLAMLKYAHTVVVSICHPDWGSQEPIPIDGSISSYDPKLRFLWVRTISDRFFVKGLPINVSMQSNCIRAMEFSLVPQSLPILVGTLARDSVCRAELGIVCAPNKTKARASYFKSRLCNASISGSNISSKMPFWCFVGVTSLEGWKGTHSSRYNVSLHVAANFGGQKHWKRRRVLHCWKKKQKTTTRKPYLFCTCFYTCVRTFCCSCTEYANCLVWRIRAPTFRRYPFWRPDHFIDI